MKNHLTRKVWFTEAAGTDSGGGTTNTTTTSGSTTDAGTAGTTGTEKTGSEAGSTEKMLPQAKVDEIVEDRLRRERQRLLGGLDLDKLKADSAKLADLEAERGSDVDKAEARVRKEVTAELTGTYNGVLRGMHVQVQAAQLGFRDASDAIAALATAGELDDIKVGSDGTVDTAAVKTKLSKLAEAKPYLLAEVEKKETPPPPPGSAGIGSGGTPGAERKATVTPGLGRVSDAYGKSGVTTTKR